MSWLCNSISLSDHTVGTLLNKWQKLMLCLRSSYSFFSENNVTNPSYESAMNENTQGSHNQEGEPSLQKSDYNIEPKESQYNNSNETLYENL